MRPAYKQHVREFVKGGRAVLVNHSLDEGLCLRDTRNCPSGTRIVNYSRRAQLLPYRRTLHRTAQ